MDSLSSEGLTHHQYHVVLIKACFDLFSKELSTIGDESQEPKINEFGEPIPSHSTFLSHFEDVLMMAENHDPELEFFGQQLVEMVMRHYLDLSNLLSRDLLWFFGGDCLHHLTDEEISGYQHLDELQYQASLENKPFNRIAARSFVFKQKTTANASNPPTKTEE